MATRCARRQHPHSYLRQTVALARSHPFCHRDGGGGGRSTHKGCLPPCLSARLPACLMTFAGGRWCSPPNMAFFSRPLLHLGEFLVALLAICVESRCFSSTPPSLPSLAISACAFPSSKGEMRPPNYGCAPSPRPPPLAAICIVCVLVIKPRGR